MIGSQIILYERLFDGYNHLLRDRKNRYTFTMITSSVCIITKNRPQYLHECLSSICNQTQLPEEIIIVENNRESKLSNITHLFPTLNIVYELEKTPNIARARNRALALATKECVVLIDDDCIPKTDWLSEIIKDFENKLVVASVGRSDNYEANSYIAEAEQQMFERWFSQFFQLKRKSILNSGEFVNSRNLALRKTFLARTHILFNVNAPFKIEDTDFGVRLFQIKLKKEMVLYNPNATVLHRNSKSLKSFFLRRYHSGKGKFFLNKTYSNWEKGIIQNFYPVAQEQSVSIAVLLWLERQFFRTGYFIEKYKTLLFKSSIKIPIFLPLKTSNDVTNEVEIQILLCNDDIENLIFALTRLFNVLNYQIPIRVYPDQSVSANDLKRIKNLFSQVSVTTESDAASHLDPWLYQNNLFSKRFAAFFCSDAKKLIFLDPDVLFLKKPVFLDRWIKSRITKNYYLKDVSNYYSYSNTESESISGRKLAKNVSAGLMLVNQPINKAAVLKSMQNGIRVVNTIKTQRVVDGWNGNPYWYLDQTIWADFLFSSKAKMLSSTYAVYADLEWSLGHSNDAVTAIHFSGPFKNAFSLYRQELNLSEHSC